MVGWRSRGRSVQHHTSHGHLRRAWRALLHRQQEQRGDNIQGEEAQLQPSVGRKSGTLTMLRVECGMLSLECWM